MNIMKILVLVLFVFLFFGSPVSAADKPGVPDRYKWTTVDTVLQSTFVALVIVDWQQTREFTGCPDKYPGKYETNPLLDEHPRARDVNRVVAGSIIVHTAVAYLLPKPYRTIWQSLWIGVEAHAVYCNYKAGIELRF